MSETKLTAMEQRGWPHHAVPTDIVVSIRQCDLGAGSIDNELCMRVGVDTVRIWPADPVRLRRFGLAVVELADAMLRTDAHPAGCVCVACIPHRKGA